MLSLQFSWLPTVMSQRLREDERGVEFSTEIFINQRIMFIIRAFTLINIVDSFCGAVQKNRNNFEPTENNPEDESVAADADEHGDAEEDGPDPLHQPSPGIS